MRLGAVNPAARKAGLHPGLPLADARARLPHIVVHDMDRAADAALLARLADLTIRYAPTVSLSDDDGLTLDITGCAHLFGGEAALFADVLKRLTRSGFVTRAAIAGTAEAAQAIARFGQGGVIGASDMHGAVSALPVVALALPAERTAQLVHLGLKTIGDLASRPQRPLAARFGEILIDRLARTLGLKDVPPAPLHPVPDCWVERRFAEPIARTDDIEAALFALAEAAADKLEQSGEGGRLFELTLFRADGVTRTLSLETGRPSRDAKVLLRLFRERIEALSDPLDPGFGFDLIRLAVLHAEPFAQEQPTLEGRRLSKRVEAGALVDQLRARLGEAPVQRFQAQDSHRPEAAGRLVPARSMRDNDAAWSPALPGEPPLRPMTLFDPPQPIDHVLSLTPDEPPRQFIWRHSQYRLTYAEGPERIEPEWWQQIRQPSPPMPGATPAPARRKTPKPPRGRSMPAAPLIAPQTGAIVHNPSPDTTPRDYYRVEDTDGRRFWLYRQLLPDAAERRWFIHGIFP